MQVRFGSIHDKSVRYYGLAPPRLSPMRHGIHLQPGRAMLVRRGNRPAADAGRRRGLPVPGLFTEGGGANLKQLCALMAYRRHCEERKRRSNPDCTPPLDELLRGACHRAALCADPLARNDVRMIFTAGGGIVIRA
jgi:hypothetical protein